MFVVETALSVAIACEARRSSIGERIVYFDSKHDRLVVTNERTTEAPFAVADSLEVALSKDLASVTQVRHVLTEKANGNLLVWIAVDDPKPEVRRKIYQRELALIDGFPEVEFDFNVVPTMGRSAQEFATGARVVFSRAG